MKSSITITPEAPEAPEQWNFRRFPIPSGDTYLRETAPFFEKLPAEAGQKNNTAGQMWL